MSESKLGRGYRRLYELLCGRHPTLRPWHFQWLPAHFLNRDLAEHLPRLVGRILDVGCGSQPYRPLLTSAKEYVGADVTPGVNTNVVIPAVGPWPFPEEHFDALLMTQVLEYVDNGSAVVAEMHRILKPNGIAIVSFPFIFNEHGANDLIRLSANSVPIFFRGFCPECLRRQGGIGSTLSILFLNWINHTLNRKYAIRLIRPLLLPLWIPLCLLVNVVALIMNGCDVTGAYYSNVFAVLRKEGHAGESIEGALEKGNSL